MSGNVWEWTRSLWGDHPSIPQYSYPYDPADGRERLDAKPDTLRVLRGGLFSVNGGHARCATRYRDFPNNRGESNGFRVVVPIPSGR